MIVDFKTCQEFEIPGLNHGTGIMSAKMVMGHLGKAILSHLHKGSSIGLHRHENSVDINYVLSGTGYAICDGKKELLSAGILHVCQSGSEHSIVNTGDDDLVLFTLVIEKSALSKQRS